MFYSKELINNLNEDIKLFPQVFPITDDMKLEFDGVQRLVMIDRYSFKDTAKQTLKVGDFVILTIKHDTKFPARGYGLITSIDWESRTCGIEINEEYRHLLETTEEQKNGLVIRNIDSIDKPLELFYEQIALRNAKGLSDVENDLNKRNEYFQKFNKILSELRFVPAGRVLYGAGSDSKVTYFNCYVMPFPKDSREGLSEHRGIVMEIMSRGGGVGTNGSTLRPKNALARGVNGKSSGSVSWLDDIAKLTHLVEQGGSRRGAQMIMLADWHPDILEFIISKMQNPKILQFIIETTEDEQIKQLAKDKLKFIPLSQQEKDLLEDYVNIYNKLGATDSKSYELAKQKLNDGGIWEVNNPEFLTGANISVCITKEFMNAIENDSDYELCFPDVENYSKDEMNYYNENWHKVGDVREWPLSIRTYRKIKASELWKLINICATYSAEPGIFFIDSANDKTNAKAYGQKVVATNPCGEQPLAPYSVCNLAAINLAEHVKDGQVDYDKLIETVQIGTRMQDNVIDATPYFLEENKKQALGERRIGMGVMGLHDLLIKCRLRYGSPEANKVVDKVFETIATTSYKTSIEIAKEKGSFPFMQEDYNVREKFINSGYMKEMPQEIRDAVLLHGIRNSHLLTVAPTGSTGTMVGVSTGLEPYFSFKYYRSGRLGKFIEVNAEIAQDWLDAHPNEELPDYFVSAMELSPEEHADTQCVIQRWVDSSISKTVNAPKGYSVSQVQKIYERLYKGGAKGGTVYVDGSRDAQVLSLTNEENKFEDNFSEEKVQYMSDLSPSKDDKVYGVEAGNTCPICRIGTVIESGGCNTCDNCSAQLKCGL